MKYLIILLLSLPVLFESKHLLAQGEQDALEVFYIDTISARLFIDISNPNNLIQFVGNKSEKPIDITIAYPNGEYRNKLSNQQVGFTVKDGKYIYLVCFFNASDSIIIERINVNYSQLVRYTKNQYGNFRANIIGKLDDGIFKSKKFDINTNILKEECLISYIEEDGKLFTSYTIYNNVKSIDTIVEIRNGIYSFYNEQKMLLMSYDSNLGIRTVYFINGSEKEIFDYNKRTVSIKDEKGKVTATKKINSDEDGQAIENEWSYSKRYFTQ